MTTRTARRPVDLDAALDYWWAPLGVLVLMVVFTHGVGEFLTPADAHVPDHPGAQIWAALWIVAGVGTLVRDRLRPLQRPVTLLLGLFALQALTTGALIAVTAR